MIERTQTVKKINLGVCLHPHIETSQLTGFYMKAQAHSQIDFLLSVYAQSCHSCNLFVRYGAYVGYYH